MLSWQRGSWGCTRSWEGTDPGELAQAGQRDIPLCDAEQRYWGSWLQLTGLLLLMVWLGFEQQVVSNCIVDNLLCVLFYHHHHYYYFPFVFCSIKLSLSLLNSLSPLMRFLPFILLILSPIPWQVG